MREYCELEMRPDKVHFRRLLEDNLRVNLPQDKVGRSIQEAAKVRPKVISVGHTSSVKYL